MKSNRLEELTQNYEALINRKNEICSNMFIILHPFVE